MAPVNVLDRFRDAARDADMSDDAIDWWLRLARPCLALDQDCDGPVVGYFGGRPALPETVAWPDGTVHLASIDLAAIPPDATDLDLPADGTLVFFAVPGMTSTAGQVVYVPAGTAVTEAAPPDPGSTVYDRFPLRGEPDWSLPRDPYQSPHYGKEGQRDDEEIFEEVVWNLGGAGGVVVLGGYGRANTGGLGVPVGDIRIEVLLAEFFLMDAEVGEDFETDYATVFYVAPREGLAARRFDQVSMVTDFHG